MGPRHQTMLAIVLLVITSVFLLSSTSYAGFTDIGVGLTGVSNCSVAWGDYDNDGDLDLAAAGYNSSNTYISSIYRNDGGSFININAGLTGVSFRASLAWGDYDNDGDLDLALAGSTGSGEVSKIYRNNSGTFTDIAAALTGVRYGTLAWGDYDNDGDLDLALAGITNTVSGKVSKIYRNDGGSFVDTGASLTPVDYCALAWGDYDNDGDLDIVLAGYVSSGNHITSIYRNDSGTFVDVNAGLIGVKNGSLAWGDYDNDGDLDLAITGAAWGLTVSRVYRNTNGSFTDINAPLIGVYDSVVVWGDYDNDGDLDLALSGFGGRQYTKIYCNESGQFQDTNTAIAQASVSSLAWGDYDNDGDLDLALAGDGNNTRILKIYNNSGFTPNTAPSAPTGLSSSMNGTSLVMSWNAASDSQTTASGLSYNVRVGRTPGSSDVFSGMANFATGLRNLPAIGNAQKKLTWTIKNLRPDVEIFYWSVQAVDTAYAGSAWSTEYQQSVELLRVSGQIKTPGGAVIAGVKVATTDGATSTLTDSNGYYELRLISGWSGTIVPSKTGYDFSPTSRSHNDLRTDQIDQDYTGGTMTDAGISLTGLYTCALAWGDYDNDGDLDLAASGRPTRDGTRLTKIYQNTGAGLVDSGIALPGVDWGSLSWGDYDNDNDLDLVITGAAYGPAVSRIYRNTNGSFTDINAPLIGVSYSASAWGDYDNDGDLDLVLAGQTDSYTKVSKLYRNDAGSFIDTCANLQNVMYGRLVWADYDNDGDLDLTLAGQTDSSSTTKIYRNDSGVLSDSGLVLPPLQWCSVAWGDYDNDGDLDLAMAGSSSGSEVGRVYRNDSGTLTDIKAAIPKTGSASVAWGDYDGDGDLDLAMAGICYDYSSARFCRIFRNNSGMFVDSGASMVGVTNNSLAWGDYDNDGDLDLAAAGAIDNTSNNNICKIYRNDFPTPNTAPAAPSGLSASAAAGGMTFTWNASSDTQTPVSGLSYNIRVGSSPGASDLFSGMANTSTGLRKLPALGNSQKRLSWTIKNLHSSTYKCYWSVQAIDSAYAGSAWTAEQQQAIPMAKISGYVRTPGGEAVEGVKLSTDDGTTSTTTNTSGYYELLCMSGWSGTVTPTKVGCWFNARSRSYTGITADQQDQNYTVGALKDIGVSMPNLYNSVVAWGDYDSDGDLDFVISGRNRSNGVLVTSIYRNNGGSFTDINAGLLPVDRGGLAWGDYDNDNDLDLAITGYIGTLSATRIYMNQGGSFIDTKAVLPDLSEGSVAWGDYDNDADLDLVLTGVSGGTHISKIYRNDYGTFVDSAAPIVQLMYSSTAWGDYDNDGDLDLVLAGMAPGSVFHCKLYRNDNGSFVDSGANLPAIYRCSVAWGDYDNDGDLDLALSGSGQSEPITRVYKNNNGVFVDIVAGLAGVRNGSVVWGDIDNDGYLDLVIAGEGITRIYRNNNGNGFTVLCDLSPEMTACSASLGDYDNDGDLDLLMSRSTSTGAISRVFRNDGFAFNLKPVAPTQLNSSVNSNDVTFSWNTGSDEQTPASGLSYNIRIGSTPGGSDIYSGMADASTGLRRLPALGNVQKRLSWKMKNMHPVSGTCYWSVQSIDHGHAGSDWAVEQQVTVPVVKISGYVRTSSGVGIQGVNLTTNNGISGATTDSSGYYELNLPNGWDGIIIPVKAGYNFNPRNKNYSSLSSDVSDQNYTGGTFVDINAAVTGMSICSLAWGDYDNDGRLELAAKGYTNGGDVANIYRSNGDSFTNTGIVLPKIRDPHTIAWGDYDNDGDLDLAIEGTGRSAKIYRNDNGSLVDINASPIIVYQGAMAWGDYDNDGDLDLAASGISGTSSGYISKIYRNDSGTFTDISAGIVGVAQSALAWGDYDNDGDLDLVIAGNKTTGERITVIYRNTGNGFEDVNAGLPDIVNGAVAWGDYDNDGDLDLALAGNNSQAGRITRIYRNDNGTFVDSKAGLPGIQWGTIAWGDYDNDGDLDIAITGTPDYYDTRFSRIYRNDNGSFVDSGIALPSVYYSYLAFGDYDNDGDLDLALAGDTGTEKICKIYRNDNPIANTAPSAPTAPAATTTGNCVTFTWNAASDNETPASGLSYNIRVGTTPGGCEVFSGMANASTGLRQLPALGNTQKKLSWTLKSLNPTTNYYWSVQAIDSAYAGSAWTTEKSTRCVVSGRIRTISGTGISGVTITASAGASSVATDASGNYTFTVPLSWSGSVTPAKTGYWFEPGSKNYSALQASVAGEDYLAAMEIDQAKQQVDSASVCTGGIVTATFGNSFYVETPSRAMGIRIDKADHGMTVGTKVQLEGATGTDVYGERYILASLISPIGTGSIDPLGVTNKVLGGGDFGYDASTGAGQRGVVDGLGLNNIGLLVTITGRVTAAGKDFFYIDDGTHARDGSVFKGVRVRCDVLPKPVKGQYVSVTGISCIMRIGDHYFRSLKPRSAVDIQVVE